MRAPPEWVKALKVGDQVAINGTRFGAPAWAITTVKRITQTQIVTEDDRCFRKDGHPVGSDIDAARAWFERRWLLARVQGIHWAHHDDATLRAVLALAALPKETP